MRNRAPLKREERELALEFTPVPRKYRHNGWTPERRKAFVEALADTGSVTRAAALVNRAQANGDASRRAGSGGVPAGGGRGARSPDLVGTRDIVNFVNFAGRGRSADPLWV